MTNARPAGSAAVALVIPAYNEARAIGEVLRRCRGLGHPVIVVDDGSTDATWTVVGGQPVDALRHPFNRGKAAALLTGIARALECGAERIITLDADGQHRPEDVPRLLAAAELVPTAIVTGSRRADARRAPRARYWANRIADFWISWAAGQAIEDTQSGFRLYPAAALRRLLDRIGRSDGFAFESEVLIEAGRAGIAIVPVPIPALYGGDRRASHFRPLRDIPKIVAMVAGKLLAYGLFPRGLWRALAGRPPAGSPLTPYRR